MHAAVASDACCAQASICSTLSLIIPPDSECQYCQQCTRLNLQEWAETYSLKDVASPKFDAALHGVMARQGAHVGSRHYGQSACLHRGLKVKTAKTRLHSF
jgi:hypothetical protein